MSKCPHCFTALGPDAFAWRCPLPDCRSVGLDEFASRVYGAPIHGGYFAAANKAEATAQAASQNAQASWPPHRPACPGCGSDLADACPACRRLLPPGIDWRGAGVTCITMSGAVATGKSVYIGTMIGLLERWLLSTAGMQLHPFDGDTQRSFELNYRRQLFMLRGLPQGTPVGTRSDAFQRDSLVFRLGTLNRVEQILVIRDVAGEDLEHLPDDTLRLSFIARADAVLYQFDPLAIESVANHLRDFMTLPAAPDVSPTDVLSNVLTLVNRYAQARRPAIAIVLSKFDGLQEFRHLRHDTQLSSIMSNNGAAFVRDPGEEQHGYDSADAELLNAEVRSLLSLLGGAGFSALLRQSGLVHQYFAVSALGHSPQGAAVDTRGIAPFRVIDPVKWALSLTGAVPTVSAK